MRAPLFALVVVHLISFASAASTDVGSPRPAAQVRLLVQVAHRCAADGPCLSEETMQQVRDETAGIWARLGVQIDWTASRRFSGNHEAPADFSVLFDELAPPIAASAGAPGAVVLAALSVTEAPCQSGTARVWIRAVRQLADAARLQGRTPGSLPPAFSEQLLARAIGRALAHEIGHYLLGTSSHTPDGLMRSVFHPQELLASAATGNRYGLEQTSPRPVCAARPAPAVEP